MLTHLTFARLLITALSSPRSALTMSLLSELVQKLPFPLHACQRRVLDAAKSDADFVAVLGTGWGKSLCYLLVALSDLSAATSAKTGTHRGGITVLLTPFDALRDDQYRQLGTLATKLGFQFAVRKAGGGAPAPATAATAPQEEPRCGECEGCQRFAGKLPRALGKSLVCQKHKKKDRRLSTLLGEAASAIGTCIAPSVRRSSAATSTSQDAAPTTKESLRPTLAELRKQPRYALEREMVDGDTPLLILTTPEYLNSTGPGAARFLFALIESKRWTNLPIDEAHGVTAYTYRPDYMQLPSIIERLKDRVLARWEGAVPPPRLSCYSATLPDAAVRELARKLKLSRGYSIVHGPLDRPNLFLLTCEFFS